jgi:glucokinase
MKSFSIGVDLGGTNLRIAAYTRDQQKLESISIPTRLEAGKYAVVKDMCDAIHEIVDKLRGERELVGVGVGSPGPLQLPSGKLYHLPNFPGWDGFELKIEIEKVLGMPVIIENDANAAALAEFLHGSGKQRGVDSLCMLTLGTGVGNGIILNRKVWHGMLGMGGEAGHGPIEYDGALCGCGGRGCLEQYASATAVSRMAKEASDAGKSDAMAKMIADKGSISAREVAVLADQGDEGASGVYSEVGRFLGITLSFLVNTLNLPLYVIGGGVASSWHLFAPKMFEVLTRDSYVYRLTAAASQMDMDPLRTSVVPALLGPESGLLGAAMLPFAELEDLAVLPS